MHSGMKTLPLLTLITLQAPLTAAAGVNMKSGSFSQTWRDLGGLTRSYDSHSMHDGLFGFGWCSELETKLRFRDGRPELERCGLAAPGVRVARRSETYVFAARGGSELVFDRLGRLTNANGPDYRYLLSYSPSNFPNHTPSQITDLKNNQTWNVELTVGGQRIGRFKASHGREVTFHYSGRGDLVEVRESGKPPAFFEYDDLHNLIAYTTPLGLTERVTYLSDLDVVTAYKRENGCEETFAYQSRRGTALAVETATARITCGAKHTTLTYEFQYFIFPEGGARLARTKSTVNGTVRQVIEHAERRPARRASGV
ncbi:MAG TPA: DUF6531 domain-containing protein [Bdellovibrionales bacterium]|nr:DUF6531 domain-containing protein [Bdellovibrionales bacterium]